MVCEPPGTPTSPATKRQTDWPNRRRRCHQCDNNPSPSHGSAAESVNAIQQTGRNGTTHRPNRSPTPRCTESEWIAPTPPYHANSRPRSSPSALAPATFSTAWPSPPRTTTPRGTADAPSTHPKHRSISSSAARNFVPAAKSSARTSNYTAIPAST
jgi:hypothetical protein